ncbi:hypothetical protein CAPTEDRAFT_188596 [Capitella teleta]|uniref:Uncharacterized protein n=1 Tax=Capitella teleta TaxID=283909 RepID=R7VAD4_CAPTE|nr:hypothetical protein CAPTEDRAFT_188596 [Capitella teleta]|eukprot:ELU15783.1 hypothetical protein CAPTEDRAFT_188596 [Capitella teleta]
MDIGHGYLPSSTYCACSTAPFTKSHFRLCGDLSPPSLHPDCSGFLSSRDSSSLKYLFPSLKIQKLEVVHDEETTCLCIPTTKMLSHREALQDEGRTMDNRTSSQVISRCRRLCVRTREKVFSHCPPYTLTAQDFLAQEARMPELGLTDTRFFITEISISITQNTEIRSCT